MSERRITRRAALGALAAPRLAPRPGAALGQVTNVVWLLDRETLRERVALARRLGLGGFSAWRLSHEDRARWADAASLTPTAAQGTNATSQR